MALLAPILFALTIGVPVAALLWVARRQDRNKTRQNGFEVGPTRSDGQRPGPDQP